MPTKAASSRSRSSCTMGGTRRQQGPHASNPRRLCRYAPRSDRRPPRPYRRQCQRRSRRRSRRSACARHLQRPQTRRPSRHRRRRRLQSRHSPRQLRPSHDRHHARSCQQLRFSRAWNDLPRPRCTGSAALRMVTFAMIIHGAQAASVWPLDLLEIVSTRTGQGGETTSLRDDRCACHPGCD